MTASRAPADAQAPPRRTSPPDAIAPVRTPDGRYLVVRGRLWRAADPALPDERREALVAELMEARRAVGRALRARQDPSESRARVDAAKRALGERGPVWWTDGAPDLGRRLVHNTPYAAWYAQLDAEGATR